ncbi:predicted protein [Uncinocarpus reesii 1704]|uniref:Major facilitator superfamily (MFS) profile domain-containing protein n=1 Tax=Uncinocarpus reesii (strain UAMH 1704) TaxID=336963 RepID=C4JHF5_UNCRE|nr:uncharacterized protein UREG_01318 [Uncinocarpus reesii 1704]EEP76469.1 predicted protein [Uncinocarpus reesii 1704]
MSPADESIHPSPDTIMSPHPPGPFLSQFPTSKTADPIGAQDGREEDRVIDAEEGTQYLGRLQLTVLTLSLCLCAFVVSLDVVILATAIPVIATEFESLGDVGWYGSSYLLTQTALQPSFGKLYNYFDTKWTFISGMVIFEVGSVVEYLQTAWAGDGGIASPATPLHIFTEY